MNNQTLIEQLLQSDYTMIISVVAIFLIVLLISWILLPFAMFGNKSRLDKIIKQNEETNDLLKEIAFKQHKREINFDDINIKADIKK